MEGEPRPRLCYLTKGDQGYGFHLHGERNKGGQFIRKVEPGSSADMAGLRPGDRLVEVNGQNVETESHRQVSDGTVLGFTDRSLRGGATPAHVQQPLEIQTMSSIPVRQLSPSPEEREGGRQGNGSNGSTRALCNGDRWLSLSL